MSIIDFFSKIHGLSSPGKLCKSQLDSCWLPPTCNCHFLHLYAYLALSVLVVVQRCCSWIGLINCILPLIVFIVFSGIMKEAFRSAPAQVILSFESCLLSVWFSAVGSNLQPQATKGGIRNLYCLGSHLDNAGQAFKSFISFC